MKNILTYILLFPSIYYSSNYVELNRKEIDDIFFNETIYLYNVNKISRRCNHATLVSSF